MLLMVIYFLMCDLMLSTAQQSSLISVYLVIRVKAKLIRFHNCYGYRLSTQFCQGRSGAYCCIYWSLIGSSLTRHTRCHPCIGLVYTLALFTVVWQRQPKHAYSYRGGYSWSSNSLYTCSKKVLSSVVLSIYPQSLLLYINMQACPSVLLVNHILVISSHLNPTINCQASMAM